MPTYLGADETPLHYDELGRVDSTPIVLLAGGAARHPDYLGDMSGLGERHRLIVPHLRGVGNSAMPEDAERASFWRQAEDIDRLRRHLELDRVILVGHSAGTRLAIAYAAQFASTLEAAVLITPPAAYLVDVPSDADALIERRRGELVFDAALSAFEAGPALTGTDADDAVFNEWQQKSAPVAYARWGAAEQANERDGGKWYLDAARAFFSVAPPPDLAARLSSVTAPVLVVAGAVDTSTGLSPVLAVAGLFPKGETAVIGDSGHYPWVEQPIEFRNAIDGFLDRLAPFSHARGDGDWHA